MKANPFSQYLTENGRDFLALRLTGIGMDRATEEMRLRFFPYTYAWKNNEKRATLFGRICRVVVRGGANSALVEFDDGQREVVSRNALRRRV